ncbi:hypothetical protein GVAV_000247 [Gurleya vavrai]
MDDLQELIKNNEHQKIINIEGIDNKYKIVAYIYLENYEEAIKLAEQKTFEYCYCLYKLKKYKQCVKCINKIYKENGERSENLEVLMSQALYFLGYYNTSIQKIKNIRTGCAAVNILAAQSLAKVGEKNEITRYKTFSKDKLTNVNHVEQLPLNEEEVVETNYNLTFQNLYDEKLFVQCLEENVDNKLCLNQLNNILGNYDLIDNLTLTNKQREIISFNQSGSELTDLQHFQKQNKEYEIFKNIEEFKKEKNKNFPISDNLKILKVLDYLKFKNKRRAKKHLDSIKDSSQKKILSFIVKKGVKTQKDIFEMIDYANKNIMF